MESQKKLIGGVLIGGAIGILAGLLLAPQTGQELRNKISRRTRDLKDDMVDSVSETMDTVRTQFNDKVSKLSKNGKEAFDTATK